MKLNKESIRQQEQWKQAGYLLPEYDRDNMIEATKQAPDWIHFGAGNIFKAFQAAAVQQMLNKGTRTKGIVVAEGYDYEIIENVSAGNDNLHIAVTLKSDGSMEKEVVGSIAEALVLNSRETQQFGRLKEIFRSESLQMVSFTITEKGYCLQGQNGDWMPAVADDFANGPAQPESYIGKVTALLYERYQNGSYPVAMVSMDNCSHNGDKLYRAVVTFAEQWCEKGLADSGFEAYVKDKTMVSFPWSMIDKITPRPDEKVLQVLKADGVEAAEPVVTARNTYIAPFVNAEECQYLIMEDVFPGGRPELKARGILFTERETVDKVEKMKVCTCLNPIHTALALFGCLLGYDLISEEMKNPVLKKMAERLGYTEGLPVVTDPGILDPQAFIDEVLQVRIPNPFMPDTPQRIATDTSQKLSIRFGETIKAYEERGLNLDDLVVIPLVSAGWLRYLTGKDDQGHEMVLSPDPILEGRTSLCQEELEALLHNKSVWGVDLNQTGLAGRVWEYFQEMSEGPGAVEAVLKKYIED